MQVKWQLRPREQSNYTGNSFSESFFSLRHKKNITKDITLQCCLDTYTLIMNNVYDKMAFMKSVKIRKGG